MWAAICDGVCMFWAGFLLVWRGLRRAYAITLWTALAYVFCAGVFILVIAWLLAFLGSATAPVFGFFRTALGSMSRWWSWSQPSEPSTSPASTLATATPAVSGLSTGVTACGRFLATRLSTAIVNRFYAELRCQRAVLDRASRITESVADRLDQLGGTGGGEKRTSSLLERLGAIFPGPGRELARLQGTCLRELRSVSQLLGEARLAHARFHARLGNFTDTQLEALNGMPRPSTGWAGTHGPGVFFQAAIHRLNALVDADSGSDIDGSELLAKIASDPELASFIRDLHTAQGAGSVFSCVFLNAIKKLDGLATKLGDESVWAEEYLERSLATLEDSLSLHQALTLSELETYVQGLSEVTIEWRDKLWELYYEIP
ncbi:uncharacterized protein C8A04DRAFT_31700 [Dichotomopilus funicola]|uniref:Uncharacterized protein n=1 Tax=Dichotomopilus funicola TaxID=1934379 RepID=A0AAN6ZK21_9PEZI|nr:hypothetical protein C8A04DRAFT_31700 [Dichotomopilus funicola]